MNYIFINLNLLQGSERVRIQANEVIQKHEGELTIIASQYSTYLERCLNESLRLYPSAYFVGRKLEEDLNLRELLILNIIIHYKYILFVPCLFYV